MCHPYHCKRGIPCSQAFRLNRICSNPISFDRGCNDLEKWVLERGYSEREVRKQILGGFSRDSLLDRENIREEQNKTAFNLTYYPVFQNVKKISTELHLLLTPDFADKAVFTNVSIIGFKMTRVLKIKLFELYYPKLMRKADPNRVGGRNVLVRYANQYTL